MPDGLYDTDLLAWSREQAERLRRVAAGERVNDVDWANVIEEIESVGRSDMRRVESLFVRAIAHALKIRAWPDELAVRHWTGEVENFLSQGHQRFERSMLQHFDMPRMYKLAVLQVRRVEWAHATPPSALPANAPFTVAELCDDDFGTRDMIARIRDAAPPA